MQTTFLLWYMVNIGQGLDSVFFQERLKFVRMTLSIVEHISGLGGSMFKVGRGSKY